MYVRRKKLEPFRPSSKSHNLASAADLFPLKVVEKKEEEQNLDAFKDGMKDAETGEPIVLSKSGWNMKEGRLNLNTQTILAMGTGRLDIRSRVREKEAVQMQKLTTRSLYMGKLSPIYSGEHTPQSTGPEDLPLHSKAAIRAGNVLNEYSYNDASGFNSPIASALSSTNVSRRNSYQPDANLNAALLARALHSIPQTPHTALSQQIPVGHRRHPLLTQYLKEGPLNPMYHRYWDPRSNTVMAEDEDGQPLGVAEEGVDDSGDETGEGEEHTALATHLSTLNSTVGHSLAMRGGGDDGSSVTSSSSMTISLASRLTGSTRRHHKRVSNKGSWSHRSRKDSETVSSRLAGSSASQAAVDLTIGVVDPAIGERFRPKDILSALGQHLLSVLLHSSSIVEQAQLAGHGGAAVPGAVRAGLAVRAQQEPHEGAGRQGRPRRSAADREGHGVSRLCSSYCVYLC